MKKPQKHKKSASSTIHPYIHTSIRPYIQSVHVPPKIQTSASATIYKREKAFKQKRDKRREAACESCCLFLCNRSFGSPCVSVTPSTYTYTFPLTFGCTNPAYLVCVFHNFFRVYSDLHIDIWIFGPHPLLTTYSILDLSFGFPQHSPNTIFASFCVWFCVCPDTLDLAFGLVDCLNTILPW